MFQGGSVFVAPQFLVLSILQHFIYLHCMLTLAYFIYENGSEQPHHTWLILILTCVRITHPPTSSATEIVGSLNFTTGYCILSTEQVEVVFNLLARLTSPFRYVLIQYYTQHCSAIPFKKVEVESPSPSTRKQDLASSFHCDTNTLHWECSVLQRWR